MRRASSFCSITSSSSLILDSWIQSFSFHLELCSCSVLSPASSPLPSHNRDYLQSIVLALLKASNFGLSYIRFPFLFTDLSFKCLFQIYYAYAGYPTPNNYAITFSFSLTSKHSSSMPYAWSWERCRNVMTVRHSCVNKRVGYGQT